MAGVKGAGSFHFDGRVRTAAARALAWTGDPFQLKAVKGVVAAADEATRAEALDAYIRRVFAIEAKGGNWEIVVANYREMLGNPAATVKEAGLAGLGRIGDGSCVAPVLAAIAGAEAPTSLVGVEALRRMQGVDVAKALTAAKQAKEAVEALELAQKLDGSPEMGKLVAAGMREAGAIGAWAAGMGLLTNWSVVGPFELGEQKAGWDTAYVNEPEVSLTGKYMAGKRRVQWEKLKEPDDRGIFNLQRYLGTGDNLIAYVYTEANVEKDCDAVLLVGSDDSARVWVNGQKVFEAFVSRGITPDQDKIPVKLKAGKNAILMKIWQDVGGWTFCARLTAPDGQPVRLKP